MQQEEVIAILRFYRDIPQRIKLNEQKTVSCFRRNKVMGSVWTVKN